MLLGLWMAALAWALWWTWELWATSALYAGGPGIVYSLWLLPTLPLFLITPFWLRARGRAAGFRLLAVVSVVAALLFVVPFHLPREHFDSAGSTTTVPASLYGFLATLTLLPTGSALASLGLILRTRPTQGAAGRADA